MHLWLAALAAAALALLMLGCAGPGMDHACRQSTGERVFTGSGGNPAFIGPALVASLFYDAVCAQREAGGDDAGGFYFGCTDLNMVSVRSFDPRVEQRVFSAEPPKQGKWCTYRERDQAKYTSHPLFGRFLDGPPSEAEIANTTALFATEVRVPKLHAGDLGDLKTFTEIWIDQGLGAKIDADLVIVDLTQQERFTVLSRSVTAGGPHDGDCVRYEYRMEERDNPHLKNRILILHDFGMICRVPGQRDRLVLAALSERYVKDQQIDSAWFAKLRSEVAEPFFAGLQIFSPAPPSE